MKENAFTHYNRDNTLYDRLLAAATDGKLPVLDNKSFELMNKEYGKEKMRTHLADYIATERPVFPLKEISIFFCLISFQSKYFFLRRINLIN